MEEYYMERFLDLSKDDKQLIEDYDLNDLEPPEGMVAIEPKSHQLFIDIDSEKALAECKRKLNTLSLGGLPISDIDIRPSRTPGHYHVKVDLKTEYSLLERIGLQAVLNSDLTREYLSLRRAFGDIQPVILFFERSQDEVGPQQQTEVPSVS